MLGTAAFASLGLFVAGVLRAEATLAAANLVYLLLLAGGAVVLPASAYGGFGDVARLLPSGALGDALRQAFWSGTYRLDLDAGAARLGRRRRRPDRQDVHVGVSTFGGRPTWLRRLGWATLVANIGIVLTGGAVRLTGSGLGCPTWPRCHGSSFTPHGALDVHSAIEFGNRTLTFVLTAIAIATFVSAWQSRPLATCVDSRSGSALSVPAQAVLGGITVLTDLNPWVVAFHLLFSMAIISLAVLYLWRIDHPVSAGPRPPSAGARSPGRRTPRPGWCSPSAPSSPAPVRTPATPRRRATGSTRSSSRRPTRTRCSCSSGSRSVCCSRCGHPALPRPWCAPPFVLVVVELAQGLIGFVQYFTDLPIVLVEFHLLGAALLIATVTWVLLEVREQSDSLTPEERTSRHPGTSYESWS